MQSISIIYNDFKNLEVNFAKYINYSLINLLMRIESM
jgi:hypothetical protein